MNKITYFSENAQFYIVFPFVWSKLIGGHATVILSLATCSQKPSVSGSSPATGYVQRWAHCCDHPANIWVSVKLVEVW